ncbi:MAG: adenylate/guanylate cyclase domain-containing protein, partial [Nocardioides sp.]|nr:adenylate/guanylate cyclase domain-containing protein [Nocardioides sp.]
GDLQSGLTALAEETLPRVEALQDYVWRRHVASAADRLLGDVPQLGELEVTTTVCFVDIVGFTARSRTLEPIELVSWVEDFEREATGLVIDHGGQVIKTIGDEVLFTVDDTADALAVAMELTRLGEDPATAVPRVRAGLAHGTVVRRLGDVFGSTVNAASRLTSLARPGTVVVDRGVHDALQDADLRWRRLRRVSAKGLPDLEAWRVRTPRSAEETAGEL